MSKYKPILTCYDCKVDPCPYCDSDRSNCCIIDTYILAIYPNRNDKKFMFGIMKNEIITNNFCSKHLVYVINTFFPNYKSILNTLLLLQ